MKTLSRAEERERSARFLNGLSSQELWSKFGVSRLSDISGLDVIGVPIWTATRPLSLSISINSGKGFSTMMSRAGAISEAIEFAYAEDPRPVEQAKTFNQMSRWRDFQLVPIERWHLARGAVITERSVFDWDTVAPIQELDSPKFLLPSGAIYLAEPTADLMRFQSSTNGWAAGANREDAVLQALYEVVERDAWTLWHWLIEHAMVWPPQITTFSDSLDDVLGRLGEQSIKPVCFNISTDTGLPCAWTVLYDLSERPAGIFSGFGCARTARRALQRSMLEAIQGRACYIAGARDDLYRRSFLLMKGIDQAKAYLQASQLATAPDTAPAVEWEYKGDWSAKEELAEALEQLGKNKFREFYVRDLGNPFEGNPYSVVKVIAPCLEQWRCAYWKPTKRLAEFTARYVIH